jgi:hypothetical protein
MDIQARIPAALCAIHNFIRIHDAADEVVYVHNDDNDDESGGGPLHDAEPAASDADEPSMRKDRIAGKMWEDYLAIRLERGIDDDEGDESRSGSEESGSEESGSDESGSDE